MTDIRLVRETPIARVVLNRPAQRNAVTSLMWQALPGLVSEIAQDPAMRIAIMEGAGDAAFSAGADIAEMEAALGDPLRMKTMQDAVQVAQQTWAELALPTMAVIRGACTGGGCGLALACDLRLATPDSFLAIPPAKLGLVYSLADTRRLVELAGPALAKEILFTGRRVGADEALRLGLVNRIVAAEEIAATSQALALEISGNAQSSVRAAKRIVNLIAAGELAETRESRALYDESFSSADFREGAAAFRQKRPPRFP